MYGESMELEGKVWKEDRWWLIEVPCLNVVTQGKTKKEAFFMIEDAVLELMKAYFAKMDKKFKISIHQYRGNYFGLSSNDSNLLLSFLLIRQREANGLSVREVACRLSSKNPNSYAQYEKGNINFSITQYEKLMRAINPKNSRILRVV